MAMLGAGAVGAAETGLVDRFDTLDPKVWYTASYASSHPWFDTEWRRDNAVLDKGLNLGLKVTPDGPKGHSGASVRTHRPHGFGRYEVVMQPARGSGMISGFFTYTGPYYGTRHDEIDIEFLGKDTTQMHVAVFVDGKLHNRFIDLGFDAADRPRRYAFEWREDSVRWFVGDRMVHEMTAADGAIPQIPGMVFANIWAADPKISNWAGPVKPGLTGKTAFDCIAFHPLVDGQILRSKLGCDVDGEG